MRTLHIFNPSHDDALAAGLAGYCPDRAARTLEADLAALPAWWAAAGDVVLLSDGAVLPGLPARSGVGGVRAAGLDRRFWDGIDRIAPWGWDALLAGRLHRLGAPSRLLLDAAALDAVRRLSSRQTAVGLLRAVRAEVPETVGTSHWCTDEDEVWRTVAHYGTAMLKAPWSGSGRGVFRAGIAPDEAVRRRVGRLLRTQGGVEVEPFYDRIADFALEFTATGEGMRFDGLSLFRTTPRGGYDGSVVADDDALCALLPPVLHATLDAVRHSLCRLLPALLGTNGFPAGTGGTSHGAYRGPLGVDMMAVRRADGTPALHPCIELNLRRTMGHVALAMRRWLPPGTAGVYRLQPVVGCRQSGYGVRQSDGDSRPIAGGECTGIVCLTPGARQIEAVLRADSAAE